MADQNKSAFAANLNSPAESEEKNRGHLSLNSGRFLILVSYSSNSGHCHSAYSLSRRDHENAPLVQNSITTELAITLDNRTQQSWYIEYYPKLQLSENSFVSIG